MKLRLINYKKVAHKSTAFKGWFSVDRFYKGKMLHVNFKHYALEIDLR